MRYEVTDTNGTTGIGEPIWAPGVNPHLYYQDALWTVEDALRQDLRIIPVDGEDDPSQAATDGVEGDPFLDAWIMAAIAALPREVVEDLGFDPSGNESGHADEHSDGGPAQ